MYNCNSDVMCAQHNHFHGWVMYIHKLFFSVYKLQSIIKQSFKIQRDWHIGSYGDRHKVMN